MPRKKKKAASFYSGTSGLQLPIPKYRFPPAFENASRLTYYSSLFNSLEVNSSFYKVPRASTVTKWAQSVGSNFKFTFKLWKEISHCKQFNFSEKDVVHFLKTIELDEDKKACLLIQLPPGISNESFLQLNGLLNCIQKNNSTNWKIAVEFRNRSWYNDNTYKLLRSFKAALVIHDMPKSATPLIRHDSDFIYLRFHGPTGKYDGSYPDDLLSEYANYIKEWLQEGKEVYCYFNNTKGDALNNLKTLNKCLKDHQ
jgi:uncharacterized protein YecE (DUF72 family)